MKKETTCSSAVSHLRIPVRSLILLFTVFLLIPALPSRADLVLQEQKVVPSDGTTDSYFGRAVAINGSTALIAAYGDNNFQGAAYLFTESNGIWSEEQILTASDGLPGDGFGSSVALADDILVVGASGANINGTSGQGAVYVFRKAGDTWVETQKLIASDGAMNDDFGVAIALSGRTLVVGADNANVNGNFSQGAAYVFTEINGSWTQTQKLTGDDGASFDHLGLALAVQGSTILVGAPSKNILTGEAYVFSRSNHFWNQTQTVIADDSAPFDQFGASLALDHATALIGAPSAIANGHASQGAAYVFASSGGTLTQTQKITSSDGANNDSFGFALALAGNRAIVGAPAKNSERGEAYAFHAIGDNWSQVGKITPSDGAMDDFFGFAVALERDKLLVGTTPGTVPHVGAAYFYAPPPRNLP